MAKLSFRNLKLSNKAHTYCCVACTNPNPFLALSFFQMKPKLTNRIFYILLASLLASSCQSRSLLPTPTIFTTQLPVTVVAPTPFIATFDDNLCEIKESFTLDGELYFTNEFATLVQQEIEGSPSYAISLLGYSRNNNPHYLTIWIKHRSSPAPNEMQTLPNKFQISDIKIYATDNTILHGDLEPVRLKLHAIPAQIVEPSDDPLVYCDYVVEGIQLR